MPAMHLISVDLPAPLSPTRAITSPARTSKSTLSSAVTGPKLFERPRVSSTGIATRSVVGTAVTALTRWSPVRTSGGSGRAASPTRMVLPQQYCLYEPTHTSDFLSCPSLYSRLMFFFVIQIGVASTDGTLRTPLFVVPLTFGWPPLIR